jgi:hypothetical protein
MPPDDLHYRFYIADNPVEVAVDGFHPPSLVDFYNETALSSSSGASPRAHQFPSFP